MTNQDGPQAAIDYSSCSGHLSPSLLQPPWFWSSVISPNPRDGNSSQVNLSCQKSVFFADSWRLKSCVWKTWQNTRVGPLTCELPFAWVTQVACQQTRVAPLPIRLCKPLATIQKPFLACVSSSRSSRVSYVQRWAGGWSKMVNFFCLCLKKNL